MKPASHPLAQAIPLALSLALAAATVTASAASAHDIGYEVENLVSNLPGHAVTTDPDLVNAWGVAFAPGGPFWVNDNGKGVSTLYTGQGQKIPLTVTVPVPKGHAGPSAPTGIVWNPTRGFLVPGTQLPAAFIFATEDGTISAWAGGLPTNPTEAVLAVDRSASGAVYKGLEFGVTAAGTFIYATNFRAGTVDVFDNTFKDASKKLLGSFHDDSVPPGYAPFGIRNIDGNLFVSFAKQNAEKHDDVAGSGHGVIDIFDTDGNLIRQFTRGGVLNSPWGIAEAPDGFGHLSRDILIGNFGNGLIHAFHRNGDYQDVMRGQNGSPLTLDGLWGLYFGGGAASNPRTLFFTAGPNGETNGLFGAIVPAK